MKDDELWKVNLLKKQNKPRKYKFDPELLSTASDYSFCCDDVSPAAITNQVNESILNDFCEKIKVAKKISDVVIVLPHIGGQFNPAPGLYTRYVMDKIKQAGADMIIGSHPHTALRCEKYNDGKSLCAYSLGNFCFTPNVGWYLPNSLADFGIVLHVYWDKQSLNFVKATFDVVKSVTSQADNITRIIPVAELYKQETNLAVKERLLIENEAIVNRLKGGCENVMPALNYCL